MNVHLQDSAKNPLVLVVDDTPEILTLIHTLLKDTYQANEPFSGLVRERSLRPKSASPYIGSTVRNRNLGNPLEPTKNVLRFVGADVA